jgi:hypothetical protein
VLREEGRRILPKDSDELFRKFQQPHGVAGKNREELRSLSHELKGLPAAERKARVEKWLAQRREGRARFHGLSDQAREEKRQKLKARIDKDIVQLRQKRLAGEITAKERRRLVRLQVMSRRFEEGKILGPRRSVGAPAP